MSIPAQRIKQLRAIILRAREDVSRNFTKIDGQSGVRGWRLTNARHIPYMDKGTMSRMFHRTKGHNIDTVPRLPPFHTSLASSWVAAKPNMVRVMKQKRDMSRAGIRNAGSVDFVFRNPQDANKWGRANYSAGTGRGQRPFSNLKTLNIRNARLKDIILYDKKFERIARRRAHVAFKKYQRGQQQ